jgi:2-polyprenyl-3-methyl-5-hydroxy-6-metoxy-1,4-benzoquinol methylase
MNIPQDYKAINKDAWNKRTDVHVTSDFYDVPSFLNGRNTLHETELHLLGDVQGKSILHLQCHFGLDSLSLSRMGATVIGIDLSDKAVAAAQQLSVQSGLEATFICADVYDLPNNLTGQFDIVFTSYGVIGWLPDMQKWGDVIQHFLKPNGTFILVEHQYRITGLEEKLPMMYSIVGKKQA